MDILTDESVEKLVNGYTNKDPFPFIVIDNFLKDHIIQNWITIHF